MIINLFKKCLLVTCVFIMLCPKRSRFASDEKAQTNENEENKIDGKEDGNAPIDNSMDNILINTNEEPNKKDGPEEDAKVSEKPVRIDQPNGSEGDDASYEDGYDDGNDDDDLYDDDDDRNEEVDKNSILDAINYDKSKANSSGNGEKKKLTVVVKHKKLHENNIEEAIKNNRPKANLGGKKVNKKLKDVVKYSATTLWHGLQLAEPGFDFDEAEMEKFKIWPRGHIPYYIDEYSFDSILQSRIRDTIVAVNSITGLNFYELRSPPLDEQTRFVFFINRRGVLPCVDYTTLNFTNHGVQKVILGYDCLTLHKSLGSLVLALAGVPPQHNSPDRDQHIIMQMENVIPEKRPLFEKLSNSDWLFHDVHYDYNSAGHYDLFKYTSNGKATFKLSINDVTTLGEEGLSYGDLWKIRMLYNYISRKRGVVGKSECSKLFVPGRKFTKYQPQSDDEANPREKPEKYLGIEEKKSGNNDLDDMQEREEQNDIVNDAVSKENGAVESETQESNKSKGEES